jgi:hypothetical protein
MRCIRKQEISDRATAYKRPNLTFPGQGVKTIFVTLDFGRVLPLDFVKSRRTACRSFCNLRGVQNGGSEWQCQLSRLPYGNYTRSFVHGTVIALQAGEGSQIIQLILCGPEGKVMRNH